MVGCRGDDLKVGLQGPLSWHGGSAALLREVPERPERAVWRRYICDRRWIAPEDSCSTCKGQVSGVCQLLLQPVLSGQGLEKAQVCWCAWYCFEWSSYHSFIFQGRESSFSWRSAKPRIELSLPKAVAGILPKSADAEGHATATSRRCHQQNAPTDWGRREGMWNGHKSSRCSERGLNVFPHWSRRTDI